MPHTYLTTDELSVRIKYDARTIRERLLLQSGAVSAVGSEGNAANDSNMEVKNA